MQIKRLILDKLSELNLIKDTSFVILFGSVSKGTANKLSDIDLCISLKLSPPKRLKVRAKLLGILPENYDVQIFEDLPLYVQKEVLSGEVLYCKNRKELMDRSLQLIRDYEDFEPVYSLYISQRKAQVRS